MFAKNERVSIKRSRRAGTVVEDRQARVGDAEAAFLVEHEDTSSVTMYWQHELEKSE